MTLGVVDPVEGIRKLESLRLCECYPYQRSIARVQDNYPYPAFERERVPEKNKPRSEIQLGSRRGDERSLCDLNRLFRLWYRRGVNRGEGAVQWRPDAKSRLVLSPKLPGSGGSQNNLRGATGFRQARSSLVL